MKHNAGFTLIELMVAISILAIVLGLGVPSLQRLIESNRISAVTNDLVAALQFARSEAIKTGTNMVVCSSDDELTCSGSWIDGWVVLAPAAAAPLRIWPPARAGTTILVAGGVTYTPLGNVSAARCFTVQIGTLQRFVGVSVGGRVATSTTACP